MNRERHDEETHVQSIPITPYRKISPIVSYREKDFWRGQFSFFASEKNAMKKCPLPSSPFSNIQAITSPLRFQTSVEIIS